MELIENEDFKYWSVLLKPRWEKVRWFKYILLLVLLVTLLCSFAIADSSVITKAVKNQITPGETAIYQITIKNNAAEKQKYSIFSFYQGWSAYPSPLKDKIFELESGDSKTINIEIRPLDDFLPNIYYVSLEIESDLGERHTVPLKIYLGSDKHIDYLPSIKVTVDMNEKITPKESVPIKLFLENKNPLDLTDLKIKIQSDIPEFVKEAIVNIPPLEKKTVEFTITPNEFQQPKIYTLFFVFERNDQTVKVIDQKIEIIPLVPDFEISIVEDSVFLKTFKELTVSNNGNVLNTQEVKVPVSFWESMFVEGDVVNVEGEKYLMWEVTLGPNESKALNSVTDYRWLLYVLILLVAFGIFYVVVRSPLAVKKTVITSKSDEGGALSEIKIMLEVRNRGSKALKTVLINDLVPAIANVEKSLELGTLRPHSVSHTKKGTKVVWSLAELDGHEHRVITYKIKAKLNILGAFSLPRVVVSFGHGKRKRKAYSNICRLSG